MLVFTIDGYQKCTSCGIYADDGGLINEMFACVICLKNNKTWSDKMKSIYNTINNNYFADGTDSKNIAYVSIYNNVEEIIDVFGSVEWFEEQGFSNGNVYKNVTVKDLIFPVITFEKESTLGGYLYEADVTKKYILNEANSYFTKRIN